MAVDLHVLRLRVRDEVVYRLPVVDASAARERIHLHFVLSGDAAEGARHHHPCMLRRSKVT